MPTSSASCGMRVPSPCRSPVRRRGERDRREETDVAVTFVLDFSDGQRVETSGNGVIGRNPVAHTPGTEMEDPGHVELITVQDDAKSGSRAHLAFGQYDGVFWVV